MKASTETKQKPVEKPDQWVMTPFGRGKRGSDTKDAWGEPRVSVLVEGYSAPHDFPPEEITAIDPPAEEKPTTAASVYRKTGAPLPMRGQHKQILVRLPNEFRAQDVEVALLQAIGDRKIELATSVGRRVGALIRQMLKKGWIEAKE